MGPLTVRDVNDATIAALKMRAATNGRSPLCDWPSFGARTVQQR